MLCFLRVYLCISLGFFNTKTSYEDLELV
uniref:Uncharacterized protein n=1 Tax=Rhizophora mucronata TaxID=61149 RepID=A0A2P2PW23_RHIMU